MTTFSSSINLSKSAVPSADTIDSYKELLDIHDAIEAIANRLEELSIVAGHIDRRLTTVATATNYIVDVLDGMVRIDATSGNLLITMPPVLDITGYEFILKRIDSVGANTVTLVGDGAELIESSATGVNLSPGSSYTLRAHPAGWDII